MLRQRLREVAGELSIRDQQLEALSSRNGGGGGGVGGGRDKGKSSAVAAAELAAEVSAHKATKAKLREVEAELRDAEKRGASTTAALEEKEAEVRGLLALNEQLLQRAEKMLEKSREKKMLKSAGASRTNVGAPSSGRKSQGRSGAGGLTPTPREHGASRSGGGGGGGV